jgi:ankyrin repeat protein
MSNKSIQQDLLTGLNELYKDAVAKKIDKDNFLDIYIPSINPAKGTHLFFNTSKGVIKIGYYVRDEKFIKLVVEKSSTSIEAASNGLRILGQPEFKNVKDALIAAKKFLSAISDSKTGNSIKNDFVLDQSLKTPLNKSKGALKTNKTVSKDIIDDFDNAIKAFKNKNMEAVVAYVEAGNPVLQFSNDNGVIDNFLIAMTSGGNLNKEKLDLYIKKGLDLDATTSDDDAYTACHFAAWDGNEDVLKMLIDAGANPDVIGGDTMTALNLASANGHVDCVKLLVSSGANIENRVRNNNQFHSDKGGTALRDAVINSFWELADYLIKSGASIEVLNEKCSNGEDFFTAVRRIYLGLDNKENNLKKIDELEKKCSKNNSKPKSTKSIELAPYVKDEKFASIALAVILEIGLDLAGGSKIVPASLYDSDILSERYNGIIGLPTSVILCSGFLEDDVLSIDEFKSSYSKIVNEVRDWFLKMSTSDIDILIPSIKACIKTIAKEWDDYMNIHGKTLCDSIKKLANEEGMADEKGMNLIQLVLDGLNISEEDWESNGDDEEDEEEEEEDEDEEEEEEDEDEEEEEEEDEDEEDEEEDEEEEEEEEEEEVDEVNIDADDFSDSEVVDFETNSNKYYKKELKRYLEITKRTGILTNEIIAQPTDKERDELWDITQVFLDRIYTLDREDNPNQHELNWLCYYSIVALHWCDIYVTDKRFSYENGRFRRDTIALVLCLSPRVSYNFEQFELVHRGFILPHMYFSVLLWTIRTIIIKKEDIFFNKYSTSDAEKALELFTKIDLKNQQNGGYGFIEMKQVPEGHPLVSIWMDIIKLFINERPPFNFILNYISHASSNSNLGILKGLFGGNKTNSLESVSLTSKDLDANTSYLNQRIENIAFEDSWPFTNDLMYIAHYMVLTQNKSIPKDVLNLILTKTSEWITDAKIKEVEKSYNNVVTEYNKNHSIKRVKYVLGKIFKYFSLQNEDNDSRDKQLRLVIGDIIDIAQLDSSNTAEYYEFIMNIDRYWGGVLEEEEIEEADEENAELGLPVIDCNAKEEKFVNQFLKESSYYNGNDSIEARLPKWMKSVVSNAILSSEQIDVLAQQIRKNKAIPILKYAPEEFYNFVKNVWWFVPIAIWKEDVLSLIVVDKNGLNSISSADTTDISLISPFDRLTEYSIVKYEPTIERLTLIFDNGAYQTFDFFVDEGENGYLSIIAAILDVRMTTINKSKKSTGWKEGAGGEGFIEFDNVNQLYDLKYWKKTEISRPDPRFFG